MMIVSLHTAGAVSMAENLTLL